MFDRYRICWSITRGTIVGRILRLMVSGQVCGFGDKGCAMDAYTEWLNCAEPVLKLAPGKCFGMIALLDEESGIILRAQTLFKPAE